MAAARCRITGAAIAASRRTWASHHWKKRCSRTYSSTPASITSRAWRLLFKVIPVENILFASEMVGAVRGIDPTTGHYYDDTKFYIDALGLSEDDRRKVFETNARRVYRLDRTDLFKRRG